MTAAAGAQAGCLPFSSLGLQGGPLLLLLRRAFQESWVARGSPAPTHTQGYASGGMYLEEAIRKALTDSVGKAQ